MEYELEQIRECLYKMEGEITRLTNYILAPDHREVVILSTTKQWKFSKKGYAKVYALSTTTTRFQAPIINQAIVLTAGVWTEIIFQEQDIVTVTSTGDTPIQVIYTNRMLL